MIKTFFYTLVFIFCHACVSAQPKAKVENIIMITIDGCRWQEVFGGADSVLLFDEKFRKSDARRLTGKFWAPTADERRRKLMPFIWNTIGKEGRIYGNRHYNNHVSVRNKTNISNPGYSEIFTGYADPAIRNNDLVDNPNTSLFSFINRQKGFEGKVAAFASWDRVLGYMNATQNNFTINGGYHDLQADSLTLLQKTLNNLQQLYHSTESSRPDYITYLHAKEYIRLHQPRALSIGFAYTDDMAHDGSYPLYLERVFIFDNMIQDLWEYIQHIPQYKDKTAMLITVDHGRGLGDQWTSHGPDIPHANETWFALIAPGVTGRGEVRTTGEYYHDQFAQTMAHLLGLHFEAEHPVGEAIGDIFK